MAWGSLLRENDEAAENLIRKMAKSGHGLCKARTRRGTPCKVLGGGAGGRCSLHGGDSTGPTTAEGRETALQALARGRARLQLLRRGIDPEGSR